MDTWYTTTAISLLTLSLHCPLPSVTEHISQISSFLTFPSAALTGNAHVKSGSFTGNVCWVPELQQLRSIPEPACRDSSPCRDSASPSCLAAESSFCHLSSAATAPTLAGSDSGTHAQAFPGYTCKRLPGWCLDRVRLLMQSTGLRRRGCQSSPQDACTTRGVPDQMPSLVCFSLTCALCKRPFLAPCLLLTQQLHTAGYPCA